MKIYCIEWKYILSTKNIFIECKYVFHRMKTFLSNANTFLSNENNFYRVIILLHFGNHSLVAGRENEPFQLRIDFFPCKMLIGGDDISNDFITLVPCFSVLVYISRSFPLRADWRKFDSSVDGEPQEQFKLHRRNCKPSFSRPAAKQ